MIEQEECDSSGEFEQGRLGLAEETELAEQLSRKMEIRADLLALTLQKVIKERKIPTKAPGEGGSAAVRDSNPFRKKQRSHNSLLVAALSGGGSK